MNKISEKVTRELGIILCWNLYLTIHLGWNGSGTEETVLKDGRQADVYTRMSSNGVFCSPALEMSSFDGVAESKSSCNSKNF